MWSIISINPINLWPISTNEYKWPFFNFLLEGIPVYFSLLKDTNETELEHPKPNNEGRKMKPTTEKTNDTCQQCTKIRKLTKRWKKIWKLMCVLIMENEALHWEILIKSCFQLQKMLNNTQLVL